MTARRRSVFQHTVLCKWCSELSSKCTDIQHEEKDYLSLIYTYKGKETDKHDVSTRKRKKKHLEMAYIIPDTYKTSLKNKQNISKGSN